jgi:hypothetical protein
LETFQQNADLLGDNGRDMLAEKMEAAATWDVDSLPQRDAFDVANVPLNDKIESWLAENFGDLPNTESGVRALLVTALDQQRIRPKDVKAMTGKAPIKGRVRYDQWWVTASTNGMVALIFAALRRENVGLSKADVAQWPLPKTIEAARKVAELTAASMGNG